MFATIPSATLLGVEGRPVWVEVHVGKGLPSYTVVGLPDTACRESRDRVKAALTTSGFDMPLRRVTVNLAPSDLRKTGAGLDLAIAIGVLVADQKLEAAAVDGCAFLGELGLDGGLRRVPGMVPLVAALPGDVAIVPPACVEEAELVGRHKVRSAPNLAELVLALRGDAPWPDPPPPGSRPAPEGEPDLADVRGHRLVRTALELAAAGGHHLLMVGPPGSGKTMLARRLPGILPDLEGAEALETTIVHSAAGRPLPPGGLLRRPPLRAPHHGASAVSLIGGGSAQLRPGEISLATNGVLFLDELGEFPAVVLDSLRQPLEEGVVRVCRAAAAVSYPARFLLVGAMNPCPCGEATTPGACRCSDAARLRYQRRLSAPLLDRFDLRLEVCRADPSDLLAGPPGESTAVVAARVAAARALAGERGVRCNAAIPGARLDELAPLDPTASTFLEHGLRVGQLTARGLHRVRRVARTIADLGGRPGPVTAEDVSLAMNLRLESDRLGMAA